MKLASLEAIVAALNSGNVRYLIAGGLAVNAHGHLRFTQDVDLVVQLRPDNIVPAFSALASLGYQPRVPVTAQQFGDAGQRQRWMREKGMMVLNFHSDRHRETPVDMFVTEPFDFDGEYEAAPRQEMAPGLFARFVSIPTLIVMKQAANRPVDEDDIQHLRWIMEEKARGKRDT